MSDEDQGEKQHEASQKKLDDARKRGEVPSSSDLSVAASFGGLLIVLYALGARLFQSLGQSLTAMLDAATDSMRPAYGLAWGGVGQSVLWAATVLSVPAALVLTNLIATRSITFSGEKLQPKASRLSIISNAKNKFGRKGLFEFVKSTLKLSLYAASLVLFLVTQLPSIGQMLLSDHGVASVQLFTLGAKLLLVAFLIACLVGLLDYLWQHAEHLRKNRMSDREVKDEQKEAEGDPHLKGQRRQRAQEYALSQTVAKTAEADVVIVNPEHYAVALAWSRAAGSAPVCVAKGVDEIAARIKDVAREASVPIHRDPPTARALHATVEIDQEISPEHFRAVAAAIRFADHVKKRKARGF